jgi:ABC-type phosphonate transport system ATPase subunit
MLITNPFLVLGIVGPCGSGKSTLMNGLSAYPFRLRHIAQEHSYVPYMWKHIARPDLLIFLDASYLETIRRRQLDWTLQEYEEQHRRLAHARAHADLYIFTDGLPPEQIVERVLAFLRQSGHLD